MWSRLIEIKSHRENRLRAGISRISAHIQTQMQALKALGQRRVENQQKWRAHHQKTCSGTPDRLHHLRRELSTFYAADLRCQQESVSLQSKVEALRKERADLETQLKRCVKKHEKLKQIQHMKL